MFSMQFLLCLFGSCECYLWFMYSLSSSAGEVYCKNLLWFWSWCLSTRGSRKQRPETWPWEKRIERILSYSCIWWQCWTGLVNAGKVIVKLWYIIYTKSTSFNHFKASKAYIILRRACVWVKFFQCIYVDEIPLHMWCLLECL
jgi:hypothetical protein